MPKEPTKLYPDGAEVAFRTMLEAIAKTGHAMGDTPGHHRAGGARLAGLSRTVGHQTRRRGPGLPRPGLFVICPVLAASSVSPSPDASQSALAGARLPTSAPRMLPARPHSRVAADQASRSDHLGRPCGMIVPGTGLRNYPREQVQMGCGPITRRLLVPGRSSLARLVADRTPNSGGPAR